MSVLSAITEVLTFAKAQIGDWYRWGADGPDYFDCSGLTQAAYEKAGITLPHNSQAQYDATPKVDDPQPGDLVFFGTTAKTIHHVGLYIGAGKMIDAPHSGAQIGVHDVYPNVVGYTRPLGLSNAPGTDLLTGGVENAGLSAGGVVKSLAFGPFAGVKADMAKLAMTGAFIAGGLALVVIGFWRGVEPTVRKVAHVGAAVATRGAAA